MRVLAAVMLIDNVGWHVASDFRVPPNISAVHLPPYSLVRVALAARLFLCPARTSSCDLMLEDGVQDLARDGPGRAGGDRPDGGDV